MVMGNRDFLVKFCIIGALLSGLLIYLNRAFDVLSIKEDSGRIVYGILMVLVISATLANGKIWPKIKYLAIWFVIFVFFMIGYSYRYELSRVTDKVMAEFIPAKGFQQKPDAVSFPVSSDGHYYIRAEVNGVPILFLADTGASHIVLSPKDAVKLGLEPEQREFDRFYETANGVVRGSSIRISDFTVGSIHLTDISASINEAAMRNSLLGMTFFKRLKGYEVRDGVLTLYR